MQKIITLQEAHPKLAQELGVSEIILKREDLHPLGSHKGRSIPVMIDEYFKQGVCDFVISSSGNAALAAARYINELNQENQNKFSLKIFVGKNINQEKLENLKKELSEQVEIKQVDNPKQQAFGLDKEGEAKFLRQSTDDLALEGYKELAGELEQIKNLSAIFIPTSSGTTAQALGELLADKNIQIHIVQTPSCCPIAVEFDRTGMGKSMTSLADAIVDQIAHRKKQVVEIIKESNGFGWVAQDSEINSAVNLIKENTDFEVTANGALGVAGLKKVLEEGWKFSGTVCCLVGGK